jgi:hypothetical protein
LELENKKLRGELDESNVRCRQLEADRQLSEREFKDAARKWLQSQETFEAEILRLNELVRINLIPNYLIIICFGNKSTIQLKRNWGKPKMI